MSRTGSVDRLSYPLPTTIFAEKGTTLKTGKRQRMGMARDIESLTLFSRQHGNNRRGQAM